MLNQKQENKLKMLRQGHINDLFINTKYDEKIDEQMLGDLFIPTGKIVANDPLCLYETEPFEKCVPAGRYSVVLYIHHIATDSRVAFAEIRFSNNIPESFELAHTENQDVETLGEDEYFGYGVDSGTGGFMDKAACDDLKILTKDIDDGMLPGLEEMLDESYVYTYSTANFQLPNSDYNLVAFSSGFGDGMYPSFWGYDEKGALCCLITDFMTIDDSDEETEENSEPPKTAEPPSFVEKIKLFFKRG